MRKYFFSSPSKRLKNKDMASMWKGNHTSVPGKQLHVARKYKHCGSVQAVFGRSGSGMILLNS